ncbi:UbiA family prenyltransferase [Deinococcus budaensis]|uniref:4-hydroxybenzoate polyprenyltransferase n=1 Tax=Deinococcus budaensis TaxID=1665626 RepID=A0A7W8GEB6_9DEIO|nr:UbiA family prenyltransferase [Deinococcus budaensis]MBB5233995.1 4-hydroxybenzoate polyprenyltransferase [Deinococcus budaensis]
MSSSIPRPGWSRRLHGHLSLARVSNSPTVVTNVLAGAALAGGGGVTLLPLAAALVLFYTGGMYLNDLLDLGIDRRERPGRPLPSGLVPVKEAWTVTAALFGMGLLLLVPVGGATFLGGLILVGLIVLYDAWHKTNPLSPVVMAATRAMVYVTAGLAFFPYLTALLVWTPLLVWATLLALYIAGLTYVAKTENRRGTARFWPVALVAAPAVYGLTGGFGPGAALLSLLLAAWVAHSLTFVYGKTRDIGGAVGRLIAGVCLLDALVLGVAGAWTLLPLALAAFLLTRWWQRHIKGT